MATKEEIIRYVMNTPANTNEAVLRSMLDTLGGGSSTVTIPVYTLNLDDINAVPIDSGYSITGEPGSMVPIPSASQLNITLEPGDTFNIEYIVAMYNDNAHNVRIDVDVNAIVILNCKDWLDFESFQYYLIGYTITEHK